MPTTNTQLSKEQLLGTWRLKACEGRADDGTILLPFTDNPEGMLTYNTDDTMIVILMKPDRPLFEANDLLKGSDEEVRAAFEGFNAYCGRFALNSEAGTVTHYLEQALLPNWIGTEQVRFVSFLDGHLSLRAPSFFAGGKEWTIYVIWER